MNRRRARGDHRGDTMAPFTVSILCLIVGLLVGGLAHLRHAAWVGVFVALAIPLFFLIASILPVPAVDASVGTVAFMVGVPLLVGMVLGAALRMGFSKSRPPEVVAREATVILVEPRDPR